MHQSLLANLLILQRVLESASSYSSRGNELRSYGPDGLLVTLAILISRAQSPASLDGSKLESEIDSEGGWRARIFASTETRNGDWLACWQTRGPSGNAVKIREGESEQWKPAS